MSGCETKASLAIQIIQHSPVQVITHGSIQLKILEEHVALTCFRHGTFTNSMSAADSQVDPNNPTISADNFNNCRLTDTFWYQPLESQKGSEGYSKSLELSVLVTGSWFPLYFPRGRNSTHTHSHKVSILEVIPSYFFCWHDLEARTVRNITYIYVSIYKYCIYLIYIYYIIYSIYLIYTILYIRVLMTNTFLDGSFN